MESQVMLKQVANLRLRFQINRRLRLESLAAISKVFRDCGEAIEDELLASIVFAVPDELLSEAGTNGKTYPPDVPPTTPPDKESPRQDPPQYPQDPPPTVPPD
jgi:hypothetical protein